PPAQPPELALVAAGDLLARDRDAARDDPEPGPRVAEERLRDGRLAAARLPDEAEDLAGRQVERDVLDDDRARAGGNPQLRHPEHGRTQRRSASASTERPSLPATASATTLIETVSAPISSAGATTAHGLIVIPERFSEIIIAQSAAGGESPSPRKLTAATSRIETVKRGPPSATIVPQMFGRISRRRTTCVRSPRAIAAST